ncbi:MAG TPA: protease modulator HflC [Beijerinckiaceae bacterium]|nr:protease modulator HflC [Beijerinckiaceae bacterium]
MRSQVLRTSLLVLGGLLIVALFAATFTVHQTQQALVLQFGAVRKVITEPGLYFKIPLAESVHYVDKRVLDLDTPVQTVLSSDRQNLEVDAFARYRITDPLRFYQASVGGSVQIANGRLTSLLNAALRNVLAGASTNDIIRTRRAELMNLIQDSVNRWAQEQAFGVEIIDVRLTRVDLPAANSQAVFQRMQTERQREAADLRATGQQQAVTIRARADREATVVVAEGTRKAEELRGQGDADKNRILAEAFGRDPDFFAFYRSMQAYEAGLKPGETRMVLSPTSDFFRYFNDPSGRGKGAAGNDGAGAPAPSRPNAAVPGASSAIGGARTGPGTTGAAP